MKLNRRNLFLASSATIHLVLCSASQAANLYWDTNGTGAAGSGAATGTWGTDAYWSTDPSGANVGSPVLTASTTSIDDLFFSAGTNGTGGTVTVNGIRNARLITFEEGAVTLTGGNVTLGGGGGITLDSAAGNSSIASALTIVGNNVISVGTGRTLVLGMGDFNRTAGATLNIQAAGTVSSTKVGLNPLTNSILGPWASFGTGANTTYATVSSSNIVAYTGGTAADTAAAVTSTAGTLNYDVAAVGALGANASINTLRYTGAAGNITGALTTKGIMNAGSGLLTFSGAVRSAASGNTTELVLNAANADITLSNTVTGTLVKTGSGTVSLGGGAAHSLGGWTVNEGVLQLSINNGSPTPSRWLPGGTINSGGTMRAGNNGKFNASSDITMNGGTLDMSTFTNTFGFVQGTGTITGSGNGNIILSTAGTFSGQITGGRVLLGLDNVLGSGSALTVNGGSLDLNGKNLSLANPLNINGSGPSSAGALANSGNGTSILTGAVVMQSASGILSNGSLTVDGVVSGEFGLTKLGNGTLTLSRRNTFTGNLTVANGTLVAGIGAGINTQNNATSGTALGLSNAGRTINVHTGATLDFSVANVFTNDYSQGAAFLPTLVISGTMTNSGTATNSALGNITLANGTLTYTTGSPFGTESGQGYGSWNLNGTVTSTGNSFITSGNASVPITLSADAVNGGNITTFDVQSGTLTASAVLGEVTRSTAPPRISGLNKTGNGTMLLTANNTYTGSTTVSAGTLIVNGSLASSVVDVTGSLAGSGVMASATLSGSGSVNPGSSPGIMTAAATDPTGGLDYNFELTQANVPPAWNLPAASINDVLRLTDATTPFTASLTGTNVISLYLGVTSLSVGDTFTGGFFTDKNADFLASVSSAQFNYFISDVSGLVTYNGFTYTAYTGAMDVSTVQVPVADFATGNVTNGYVTQFTVAIPEPRAALLGAIGLLALLRRRRA